MIQNSAPPDYTGSDKSFYTVQTKKLTNEKKNNENLVQKRAHRTLPFKNLHDSAGTV